MLNSLTGHTLLYLRVQPTLNFQTASTASLIASAKLKLRHPYNNDSGYAA